MKQKKQVRLSDIAEKLNISTVTVSKALSNKDGVGDELREQIKKLAVEMGYKIKSSAGTTGTTGNIGIVIPARFFSPDASFYWYIFNHLSKALLEKGWYSIMELVSDEDEKDLIPPRLITDKKTDGIIFLGQLSFEYIKNLASTYSNFVLMDYYIADPEIDCIVNDDYYNSYLITSYLISMGHKKIQYVGKFNATTSIQDRYMGFEKAMYENGLDCPFDKIIDDRNAPAELTNIPMYIDPSHIAGKREFVEELLHAGINVYNFDGAMIESHYDPDNAWTDSKQQYKPTDLKEVVDKVISYNNSDKSSFDPLYLENLRKKIDYIDTCLIFSLVERLNLSKEVGKYKKENHMKTFQPDRWNSLLTNIVAFGKEHGLDENYVKDIWEIIHEKSIEVQK